MPSTRATTSRRGGPPEPGAAAPPSPQGLEAAAALLSLAMAESQAPVARLGAALVHMIQALAQHGRTGASGLPDAASYGAFMAVVERELAVCVEELQFHDRLMQQLTQVRDCVAALRDPSAQFPDGQWLKRRSRTVSGEGSVELF
ncbi:MAG TPA: hypothetical protein VMB48_16810 [Steroidobacteraceae bacterium]|nr:hypothetical protein [Steroidobacteraceae bacterium]